MIDVVKNIPHSNSGPMPLFFLLHAITCFTSMIYTNLDFLLCKEISVHASLRSSKDVSASISSFQGLSFCFENLAQPDTSKSEKWNQRFLITFINCLVQWEKTDIALCVLAWHTQLCYLITLLLHLIELPNDNGNSFPGSFLLIWHQFIINQ